MNNSYVFLLALLCNMHIVVASEDLVYCITSKEDMNRLKTELTHLVIAQVKQRALDWNRYDIADHKISIQTSLTNFNKRGKSAVYIVKGWYEEELYTSYPPEWKCFHGVESRLVKMSENQFNRLNWYGCTVS